MELLQESRDECRAGGLLAKELHKLSMYVHTSDVCGCVDVEEYVIIIHYVCT